MTDQQKERIRELIERRTSPVPIAGCWLWEGSTQSRGYGDFRAFNKHRTAHRASYEAHVGPIPDGMQVCHRCDVRACCNPAHLFLGTNNDNIADAVAKGRKKLPGVRNGNHKLDEHGVRMVRGMVADGFTYTYIASVVGLSKSAIQHIAQRRNWAFLD